MEKDLIDRLQSFKLSRTEEAEVVLEDDEVREGAKFCENSLVGKIFMETPTNFSIIRKVLSEAWECDALQMYLVKPSIVHFIIPSKNVRDLILKYSPWSFDNRLISIKPWSSGMVIEDVLFDIVMFWIRVMKLPLELTSEVVAHKLASTFCGCEKLEIRDLGINGGRYIRMRVGVDVSQPFRRWIKLSHEGKPIWAALNYERLPALCYFCGRVDHEFKSCSWRGPNDQQLSNGEKQFGSWLKASGGTGKLKRDTLQNYMSSSSSNPDNQVHCSDENILIPMLDRNPQKVQIADCPSTGAMQRDKIGDGTGQSSSHSMTLPSRKVHNDSSASHRVAAHQMTYTNPMVHHQLGPSNKIQGLYDMEIPMGLDCQSQESEVPNQVNNETQSIEEFSVLKSPAPIHLVPHLIISTEPISPPHSMPAGSQGTHPRAWKRKARGIHLQPSLWLDKNELIKGKGRQFMRVVN